MSVGSGPDNCIKVTAVAEGSPAFLSEIKRGYVILKVNGEKVTISNITKKLDDIKKQRKGTLTIRQE